MTTETITASGRAVTVDPQLEVRPSWGPVLLACFLRLGLLITTQVALFAALRGAGSRYPTGGPSPPFPSVSAWPRRCSTGAT
jgi:hypothetical protein